MRTYAANWHTTPGEIMRI